MTDTLPPENVEWQLADLVDALANEVDRAQDTLLFKANTRSLSMALRGLNLDVAVDARLDGAGKVLFRTIDPGRSSATVLRLQFEEITQGQIEEVRRPADTQPGSLPLATLPDVRPGEIAALEAVSIFTVDDLRRAAATPALTAELSRRTKIPEARLRRWLGLPFFERIVPATGAPGQEATIEGGNLGVRDDGDQVFFQGTATAVVSWTANAIRVRVPADARTGVVYGLLDGAATNTVPWEAGDSAPLELQLSSLSPASGTAGQTLTMQVSGNGFGAGTTLSLGTGITVRRLRIDSGSRLTANLEIAPQAAPGPRDVTATALGAIATLPEAFMVLAAEVLGDLTLKAIDPAQAPAGTSLAVTITGTGFVTGAQVDFGRPLEVADVTVVSATEIRLRLTIPPQAAGPRPVSVHLPDGRKVTRRQAFTVLIPEPGTARASGKK